MGDGDMPSQYDFTVLPEMAADAEAVARLLPELQVKLLTGLGWDRLGLGPGPEAARALYFGSGHGMIFKCQPRNPFANLLRKGSFVEAL
jgi:hypothetical protein